MWNIERTAVQYNIENLIRRNPVNLIEYRAAILLHTMEFVDGVTGGWITYDSIFNEK